VFSSILVRRDFSAFGMQPFVAVSMIEISRLDSEESDGTRFSK